MATLEWSSNLSVNVAEIDTQHRKLIDMINELNTAMMEGKGRTVIGNIINGLIEYAGSHFATEEKYFDQFLYPDSFNHKSTHKEFVKNVSKFKENFDKGSLSVTIEVMNFLKDWLRNHILRDDKKYTPYFNRKGLV
jgi:hemerythrin